VIGPVVRPRDGDLASLDVRAATRSILWVEVARILAIVAVIFIHVGSPLVSQANHQGSWWTGNLVESATRWCVPLFVMISGGLVLASPKTLAMTDFYRRRVTRLGLPMVVWIVAYLLFGRAVSGNPATLEAALTSVAAGRPYYHLYFLFVIAGVSLVAPVLAWAIQGRDHQQVLRFVAVAFTLAMIDNALTSLLQIGTPNAVTRFVPYVADFLAGYALLSVRPTRARRRGAIGIVVIGVLLTAIGTWVLTQPNVLGPGRGLYLYEYHSITTIPVSLAVYQLLVWSGPWIEAHIVGQVGRVIAVLGAASFGVYLLHPMVLFGLSRQGISATTTIAPVAILLTVALAFSISLVAVVALRRVPWIRTIV
jgi:surface polysaccharide O-acyltransferase-like enzyme